MEETKNTATAEKAESTDIKSAEAKAEKIAVTIAASPNHTDTSPAVAASAINATTAIIAQ